MESIPFSQRSAGAFFAAAFFAGAFFAVAISFLLDQVAKRAAPRRRTPVRNSYSPPKVGERRAAMRFGMAKQY